MSIGYPLLLGTSRKSFFGGNVEDRLIPTVNTTALAAQKGYLFVRVHDIAENKAAIDAVLHAKGSNIQPTEEEGEEKKEKLSDVVADIDKSFVPVQVAEEAPVEEVLEEEAPAEEVVEETNIEDFVIQGKDEAEEAQGEVAPETMEEFKKAINKYVDYKPGRGLPMREDIKINRFGSDEDTDYSTF